jgi:uncharacterized protein YndB with AHSA1/START domain
MAQAETTAVIVETIAIEAPIQAVFAALTEPAQLVRWWGSDDAYRCAEMEVDLRPGGAWKISGKNRQGEAFDVRGVYRIVEPPHVLEFTWIHDWHDDDVATGDTIVRYDLEEIGAITRLRVTHSGFTSASDREEHAGGWVLVLGWLRSYHAAIRADA